MLSSLRKVFSGLEVRRCGADARFDESINSTSSLLPQVTTLLRQNSKFASLLILHLFACLAMSLQKSLWWWQQRHRKVGACALQVTLMGCNCYLGHNSKDVGAPPAQFSFTPMFQLLLQCPTYMQCLILSTKCESEHFPILVMFSYCSFDVTMVWNQMVTWVNRVVR